LRFEVNWTETAYDELAAIWLQVSPEQHQALRDATNRLERELTSNAQLKGRPCDGDRLLRIGILTFFFSVSETERLAEVRGVSLLEE
jgi:hypothetical protein